MIKLCFGPRCTNFASRSLRRKMDSTTLTNKSNMIVTDVITPIAMQKIWSIAERASKFKVKILRDVYDDTAIISFTVNKNCNGFFQYKPVNKSTTKRNIFGTKQRNKIGNCNEIKVFMGRSFVLQETINWLMNLQTATDTLQHSTECSTWYIVKGRFCMTSSLRTLWNLFP